MTAEANISEIVDSSLTKNPEEFIPRTEKVARAWELATSAHEGQIRAEGKPYVTHCIAVAQILEGWGIQEENMITAALLHDVVEDSPTTLEAIEASFGVDVAELVDGVSKFRSASGKTDDRETLKKFFTKTYIDPRMAVLKLADRLHNMRTLAPMPEHKRIAKSRETLDVYTGLAESLGMWEVKIELEDLAFQYVKPHEYQEVIDEVESDTRLNPAFLGYWTSNLERVLVEEGFIGRVVVRKNGLFSLSEKRRRAALQGKSLPGSFSEINDLVSFRVILPEIGDCYRCVGALHHNFGERVDFKRFDEFFGANRRTNGYQALQTTLDLPQGATEIAVVTEELEEFNHWGVVNLMRSGGQELSEYVLKLIFTPKGEARFLPRGATGVDFAYSLSERLGAQAESLLVDGKQMALTTVIPNASTVEVLFAEETRSAPDPELLEYCLPATGQKIEDQLIIAERDRFVKEGKESMEPDIETRGLLDLGDLGERVTELVYWFGCQRLDDLYFKVGGGYLPVSDIANWLDKEGITKNELGWTTIQVSGEDDKGILKDLTAWIFEQGGNIINVAIPKRGDRYVLRLVLEDMGGKGDEALRRHLAADARFETWKVV